MDPRYSRPSSPPRHYPRNPARNSASVLDLHPTYDQYGNPIPIRGVPERLAPRQPPPPRVYRDAPTRGARLDDIPSRRLEPIRRPLSVNPPSTSVSNAYRPTPAERSPYNPKPWPRDDESYYVQPAASARHDPHNRHISLDNRKPDPYLVPARSDRDRPERGGYRSSGIGGSRQQYHDVPQIRPPRDKDDKDFGYEYTDMKEQAYRDTAPRARPRRTSDLGARERPHSIIGIEDTQRGSRPPREGYGREAGPPVSTRGFSKIDRNGSIRHEYRYPREPDSARSGDESDGPSRRRSTKPAVSLHQERPDGYSSTSNMEERGPREHRHRHRADSHERGNRPRNESIDRSVRSRPEDLGHTSRRRGESFDRGNDDRSRYTNDSEDLRRKDYREKRQDSVRSESEDRRARHHHHHKQHREGSQDRYKPEPSRRVEEPEREYKEHRHRDRGDESEREPKHRDRGDDYDKRRDDGKKDKHDSHYGTGAALGAAGAAAAGLLGAKHHYNKEKEKAGSEASSERTREGKQTLAPEPSETSSRSEENSDVERRERRRKRREERDARARQEAAAAGASERLVPPPTTSTRSGSRDRSGQYPPPNADPSDDERKSRRHRRKPSERRHSSTDSDGDGNEPSRPRQVRVVSPAKEPEIKPKGILRRPREKFPEDPAPVREGVAPLKDAGKKGIPPNARWTKIDRRLVNPEALEMGNERFEERLDYVIVLRVLSKEEIEQYAQKTVELREERHKEANSRRLEAPKDHGDYSDDGYDSEKPAPKALDDHAYSSNEHLPSRDREHERMAPYNQAPPASNMTASMPSLIPNVSEADPNRPELYPSNSYHRPAPPPASSNASSATSNAYPPPPPQQAPPPQAYPAQQPVTGEYTSGGYPAVPPLSQPVYPPPNNYQQAPIPPAPGVPQNMPWQPPPGPHQQQEPEPIPVPR